MFVAEPCEPSASVDVDCTIQSLPTRCQTPSLIPPSVSNTHERMVPAAASQPITCVPSSSTPLAVLTANAPVKKCPFFAHCHVVSTVASGESSTQSPTSHDSSSSAPCSSAGGVGMSVSRTLFRYHTPSLLT